MSGVRRAKVKAQRKRLPRASDSCQTGLFLIIFQDAVKLLHQVS